MPPPLLEVPVPHQSVTKITPFRRFLYADEYLGTILSDTPPRDTGTEVIEKVVPHTGYWIRTQTAASFPFRVRKSSSSPYSLFHLYPPCINELGTASGKIYYALNCSSAVKKKITLAITEMSEIGWVLNSDARDRWLEPRHMLCFRYLKSLGKFRTRNEMYHASAVNTR